MKRKTRMLVLGAAALMGLAGFRQAVGQVPVTIPRDAVSIRRIDAGRTRTPVYNQRSQINVRDDIREWFRIEVEFESRPEWLDEVTLTYHVLLRNDALARPGDPRSAFRLLRGQVTKVNVPSGRRNYSVMFVHPRTIERFGAVERIAVIASSGGVVLDTSTQPESRTRWWEELPPVEGMLLNRMETPFAMIAFDRYEAIRSGATAR